MSAAGKPSATANQSETIFHLRQAFKLALSMVLLYWLALWHNWDVPKYGGLAIVIISLGTSGATIEKGIMRFLGTIVGVSVGFLILGLFNHDRWATMLALSVHLTVMGYFMQASRYPYAWYAAGFIPLVIWGDNYPNFDKAFYFGTFRWLETTAGILIYTVVDLVFWPRHAGEQLDSQGRDLWAEVREQFRNYRRQLDEGQLPDGASELRTKLAGTLTRTMATLQQAYLDTPAVSSQKRVWEVWRMNARALVDALEVWRESIDDCRELDLDRLLPQLGSALGTLDKRIERIGVLWRKIQAADNSPDTDDSSLAETLALDLDSAACLDLTHFERAALMSFLGQLEILDQASRELLRTMRVLAGQEASRGFRASSHVRDLFRPSRWDPSRLIHSLFPPATFIAGFFFWVLIYPPPGQMVPMMAAIFAILILQTPMPPFAIAEMWMLSMVIAIAPIYFLVMPALSTGFGLLSLIFIYSFVFGYLGGRSPALKSGPILMFVLMTGISNQQSYSFEALVDGALMIILAGLIVTVVYYFFSPIRPEQALLRSLHRFFHGCGRVIGGFALDGPSQQANARRRQRYFQSLVLPAPAKIQTAQKTLEYKLYPDNDPDKVQRLHDSVQSIAYRLESLELAHDRIARHPSAFPPSLIPLGKQVSETLQRVFDRWARFEPGDAFQQQRGQLQHWARDWQQQLDTLRTEQDQSPTSEQLLTDLYTMIGCVRGTIEAMANAQVVISQINWQQWATARF